MMDIRAAPALFQIQRKKKMFAAPNFSNLRRGPVRRVPSVRRIGAADLRRVCRVSPRILPECPLCRL